jgi:hypothetical protein
MNRHPIHRPTHPPVRLPTAAACLALLLTAHPGASAATVDPTSALNATMTESTVELSAILATMNRKIHNGESFDFGQRSWTGSTTAAGFHWDLEGMYDGKAVSAFADGVYDAGTTSVAPTITWTTHLRLGAEEVTSSGTNTMSSDESPTLRGWSWKNVWKKVTQVATWVQKNWYEISTIANQALTVIALPNPLTVAVQAVSSAGKIAVHQVLPVPIVGDDGSLTEGLSESDYDIGDIVFGAGLQFTDLGNPTQVAGMGGSIDAQMTVDASYVDRLAIGNISASYLNLNLNSPANVAAGFSGSANLGQAPEPGSVALVGAALALLCGVRRLGQRGRGMARAAEAARAANTAAG